MNIDTKRIISEVHLRPVLWYRKCELFKDRVAREQAWQEIYKKLVPNYINMNKGERKEIGE